MKCKNCGNECAVGKFCNQCGALLPVEEEVKSAEAAPAQAPQSTQAEARPEPEQAAEQAAPAVQAESAPSEAAPEQEAPAAETAEVPAAETPVQEEPLKETPAAEAPVQEEPVKEVPAAEAPVQEEPVKEVSAAETPAAEQPAPVQTIPVAAPVQTAPSAAPVAAAPAGNDIKGKIREICGKVKAKMGEKAYKGVGLWVPAILPAFWGLLIILFLAADGVNAGGFIRDSGYGVMGGMYGGGAAFGAVMCLLIGLAYIGLGVFRIVLAVKKPYLTPKFVVPTQLGLYGALFLMSCVMVGSINTYMGGAHSGPAGNCILAFTIIGAIFVAAGILLFKFGCVDELIELRKNAAAEYAEERKKKLAEQAAAQAAAQSAAASAAMAAMQLAASADPAKSMGEGAAAVPQVVYVQGDAKPSMEDELFGKIPMKKKIINYRWSGAVASLVAVLFIAIAGVLPLSEIRGGGAYSGFSFVYTTFVMLAENAYYSAGEYALSILFLVLELAAFALCALFAFLHLRIAIKQPYTQHPIFGMFHLWFTTIAAGLMTYMVVWSGIIDSYSSDIGYIISAIIALILLAVVLAGCMFGVILYIVCARTDENRYLIKKKRLQLRDDPSSDTAGIKSRKKFAIAVAVIALVAFILSVAMPAMKSSNRGFDPNVAISFRVGESYYDIVDALGEPYSVNTTSDNGKVAYWYSKSYTDVMGKGNNSGSDDDFDDIEDWEDLENAFEDSMKEEEERQQQLDGLVYQYYKITFDKNNYMTYLVYDNNCSYRSGNSEEKRLSYGNMSLEEYVNGGNSTFGFNVSVAYDDGSYEAGYVDTLYSFDYSGNSTFKYNSVLSDDPVPVTAQGISSSDIVDFGNAAYIDLGIDTYLYKIGGILIGAEDKADSNAEITSSDISVSGATIYVDYSLTGIDGAIAKLASTGKVRGFVVTDKIGGSRVTGGTYAGSENGSLYTYSSTNRKLLFASYADTKSNTSIFETLKIRIVGSYAFNYYSRNTAITTLPAMGPGTSGYMGVTTLEDYAFAGSTFTRVTIPSCVTSVGSKIFYGCSDGSVTLSGRTSVPSSWPSDWAVYNSSGYAWDIYNQDGTRIN